jgi:hypothetical protein
MKVKNGVEVKLHIVLSNSLRSELISMTFRVLFFLVEDFSLLAEGFGDFPRYLISKLG